MYSHKPAFNWVSIDEWSQRITYLTRKILKSNYKSKCQNKGVIRCVKQIRFIKANRLRRAN